MKIAILGTKGVPGHHGVEVVVDSLLPHLSNLGYEITVYGYDTYTEEMSDYAGAQVKVVPGSSSGSLEMISHMWNASAATNKEAFDIVHIHSTDPCLLAWKPKARFGTIATSHGQAYLRKKWGLIPRTMSKIAERFFIHVPHKITSVSKPLADYYQKKYKQDVHYIPNGILFMKKPPEAFLKKWDLKPQGFLFCSAGRVERTKGLHTLFQAYAALDTDLPLVIAGGGSGSDPEYLDQLTRNKPDRVLFTGFLTGDEFYALYAHARVFVFPSEYEAMSMALLEGLSFGTPTVYSDIPENIAVADGLAYPFKMSDANSLASQLGIVLGQYNDAVALGQKARSEIRQNHDWAKIAAQYHQLYLAMAASK
ncbi:glycosyltransferase family 4 protein [Desulfosarcina ovata]|uniref:Glycosyl transferase n=1 Tax=Desulfosarcina ovata subsp. ovata TaxID=2752305 RepID=A0A5K8AJJ8_9BACT|nr:glycosyltransferase family 4 protein [Desulfosarcina ovata]BBO92872.1 glycosyl transferase [Desulfosarcina ovata subsp. ovata]